MQTRPIFDMSPLLHAAATHLGHRVTGDVRWLHCDAEELDRLTPSDRELILVTTGESLPDVAPEGDLLVSFFVRQLALDRATGALPYGRDVSIAYVEAVFDAYEGCLGGNPVSDDLFDLALAFLVGRELARLGPDALSFG